MKRKNQFDQSKIIPAQPGWYACDINSSEDLKKCESINYVPVIAWAITEGEEMEYGDIGRAITLPIFVTGGPSHALTSLVADGECSLLFYKDPNGNFFSDNEWLGSGEEAEAGLIEIYTKVLGWKNRG